MENMIAVVDGLTGGKGTGFLLFGHTDGLIMQNPLEVAWTNGRREFVRLTELLENSMHTLIGWGHVFTSSDAYGLGAGKSDRPWWS